MRSKEIVFDIEKCSENCAADLDEFIADIQVDNWIVNKKMNFTDRVAEPTFMALDIFDSRVVNTMPNVVLVNQINMRRNSIVTEDAFYNFDPSWESSFYDVGKKMSRPLNKKAKNLENLLYRSTMWLTSEEIVH